MKTLFRLLGIRWWQTTRRYTAPETIGAGYKWPGLIITREWRHQRCALSGVARRQYFDGRRWRTDRSFKP